MSNLLSFCFHINFFCWLDHLYETMYPFWFNLITWNHISSITTGNFLHYTNLSLQVTDEICRQKWQNYCLTDGTDSKLFKAHCPWWKFYLTNYNKGVLVTSPVNNIFLNQTTLKLNLFPYKMPYFSVFYVNKM